MADYKIDEYLSFLPTKLIEKSIEFMSKSNVSERLLIDKKLLKDFPSLESDKFHDFLIELTTKSSSHLNTILKQRKIDREFIDSKTREYVKINKDRNHDYLSEDYLTVIGEKDVRGRVVIGPLNENIKLQRVEVPNYLKGDQVTLFGPPDTEKMCINAINAIHKKNDNEPEIIEELIENKNLSIFWGADCEDSKTPIPCDLLKAQDNIRKVFDDSLEYFDDKKNKLYKMKDKQRAKPIKRFVGLALPSISHLIDSCPIPLHIYDFGMHIFNNWKNKNSLCFYVPKLENEEEAEYLKNMIQTAEEIIKRDNPEYSIGSVKLYIVFEGPRAIFRIQEIANKLNPYFVGGSLGWHDFLAATARAFKNDPNYRIPVKADANIVINHIAESHKILANKLGEIGALKLGGMYGVLYENNEDSYQMSLIGYFKDVITQYKRGLNGFWVAHPDFVRLGLAIVEAFKTDKKNNDLKLMNKLFIAFIKDKSEIVKLTEFYKSVDAKGIDKNSKSYLRGVLAANIKESDVISNNDPSEIRYNIFQALQYLTDWLCGNGCVALPSTLKGDHLEVKIRVMDDLATTERSRWELWAEINHGRFSIDLFNQILDEEMNFIKNDLSSDTRSVAVKWNDQTKKWYPVAKEILQKLVISKDPVEFVPQLLFPYLYDFIRENDFPEKALKEHLN